MVLLAAVIPELGNRFLVVESDPSAPLIIGLIFLRLGLDNSGQNAGRAPLCSLLALLHTAATQDEGYKLRERFRGIASIFDVLPTKAANPIGIADTAGLMPNHRRLTAAAFPAVIAVVAKDAFGFHLWCGGLSDALNGDGIGPPGLCFLGKEKGPRIHRTSLLESTDTPSAGLV